MTAQWQLWRTLLPDMDKTWKVILAFAGVFIAGGICGGLLEHRMDRMARAGNRPVLNQNFWPQLMQRLVGRLDLTPEQRQKIQLIVRHSQVEAQKQRRDHVGNIVRIMDQMHVEISSLLLPAQRVKLEELRARFRERIERERGEARGAGWPAD